MNRIAPAPNRTAGYTWAPRSFPRTRATPAERERRERAASAASGESRGGRLRKKRKSSPTRVSRRRSVRSHASRAVHGGGARAAERARKEAVAAHAAAEKDARLGRRVPRKLANETDREPRVALVRLVRAGDGLETRTAPAASTGGKPARAKTNPLRPRVLRRSLAAPGDVGDEKSRGVLERGAQTRALSPPRASRRRREARERDATVAAGGSESPASPLRAGPGASALAGTKADDKKGLVSRRDGTHSRTRRARTPRSRRRADGAALRARARLGEEGARRRYPAAGAQRCPARTTSGRRWRRCEGSRR